MKQVNADLMKNNKKIFRFPIHRVLPIEVKVSSIHERKSIMGNMDNWTCYNEEKYMNIYYLDMSKLINEKIKVTFKHWFPNFVHSLSSNLEPIASDNIWLWSIIDFKASFTLFCYQHIATNKSKPRKWCKTKLF